MSVKKASAEIVEFEDARSRLREGEPDPAVFPTAGAYLEAVRLHAGLSPDAIADRTHIKPRFIAAIEAMDLKALPPRPFVLGFVKSIAESLQLEPEAVVERYRREIGAPAKAGAEAAEAEHVAKAAAPVAAMGDERPELTLLAAVAVLAFICWCAFWITRPRADAELTADVAEAAPMVQDRGGAAVLEPAAPPAGFPAEAPPSAPVLVEARILQRVEPVYPLRCETVALETEIVAVAFTVRIDGRVVSERVVSSTNACFERAALNAVRQWRFSPRTIGGAPAPAFDQRVTFAFERPL